jgi:hypothetical protein
VKLKLALVWLVGLLGVEVIVGGDGAVPSIVQENFVAALWLPAASRALTEKVWLPWLRPEYVAALVQGLEVLPSS